MTKLNKDTIIDFVMNNSKSYSKYQTQHFVVDQALTPYRKLRQIALELQQRNRTKEEIELAILELKIENEIRDEEISSGGKSPAETKLLKVRNDKNNLSIRDNKSQLKTVEEDIDLFIDMIREFISSEEELFNLSEHDEEEEQIYWKTRMTKQASLDMLTTGKIGAGNLDNILNMRPEDQVDVVQQTLSYTDRMNRTMHKLEQQVINDNNKTSIGQSQIPSLQDDSNNEKDI